MMVSYLQNNCSASQYEKVLVFWGRGKNIETPYNWPGKYKNTTPISGFPFLIIFPSANSAGAPRAPLAKPPSQIRSGHNPKLALCFGYCGINNSTWLVRDICLCCLFNTSRGC